MQQIGPLILVLLLLTACVPKPEPYVLDERHETAEDIAKEMAQIEAQAKEQAREKFAEDQQKVQEQQQEAQAAANITSQMVVQTEQQKAGMALGLYPNYFMDGDAFKSNFITVVGDEAPSSYVVAVSNLMARTPGNKPTGFSMLASEI
jgi:starvation-inducible outer membrane lipoprotein